MQVLLLLKTNLNTSMQQYSCRSQLTRKLLTDNNFQRCKLHSFRITFDQQIHSRKNWRYRMLLLNVHAPVWVCVDVLQKRSCEKYLNKTQVVWNPINIGLDSLKPAPPTPSGEYLPLHAARHKVSGMRTNCILCVCVHVLHYSTNTFTNHISKYQRSNFIYNVWQDHAWNGVGLGGGGDSRPKNLTFHNQIFLFFLLANTTHRCLSIFLASLYLRSRFLSTRMRRIHRILVGIRALAVPLRLPWPMWRPLRRARAFLRTRARECTLTGLRIMRPSLISLRMFWPENKTSHVTNLQIQMIHLQHWKTASTNWHLYRIPYLFKHQVLDWQPSSASIIVTEHTWKIDICAPHNFISDFFFSIKLFSLSCSLLVMLIQYALNMCLESSLYSLFYNDMSKPSNWAFVWLWMFNAMLQSMCIF